MYVNFTPENATNTKIIWTSSDESVATVDAGLVRVHKAGSAVITATSEDGGYRDSCSIGPIKRITSLTVTNNKNPLSNTLQLQVTDSSLTITPSVLPLDATNKTISFSSSDTSVARVSVDENNVCTVQPQKAGTCRIAARATDGSQKVAYVDLTIIAVVTELHLYRGSPEAEISTQSMTEYNLITNSTNSEGVRYVDISALCKPDNAHDKTLNWTTNDVYTISSLSIPDNRDDKRRITAVKNGDVVVTVGAVDRVDTNGVPLIYKQFKIKSTTLAETIQKKTYTQGSYTITTNNGTTQTLSANIPNASNGNTPRNTTIYWSSDKTNIATVSSSTTANGGSITVTAKGNGSCTIYAKTKASDSLGGTEKVVSWTINVKTLSTQVNISTTSKTITCNISGQTTFTINGNTSSSNGWTPSTNSVKWSSSNSNIASVSSSDATTGNVTITGKGKGTCTLTATAADGTGKTKTCSVTVKKGVTGISITKISTCGGGGYSDQKSETPSSPSDFWQNSMYDSVWGKYVTFCRIGADGWCDGVKVYYSVSPSDASDTGVGCSVSSSYNLSSCQVSSIESGYVRITFSGYPWYDSSKNKANIRVNEITANDGYGAKTNPMLIQNYW